MYAVLLSVVRFVFPWLMRASMAKWTVSVLIIAIVGLLFEVLFSALPSFLTGSSALSAPLASLPPGFWYLMDYFQLQTAISLSLSAHVARFLIRRIPFIG